MQRFSLRTKSLYFWEGKKDILKSFVCAPAIFCLSPVIIFSEPRQSRVWATSNNVLKNVNIYYIWVVRLFPNNILLHLPILGYLAMAPILLFYFDAVYLLHLLAPVPTTVYSVHCPGGISHVFWRQGLEKTISFFF